MSEHSDNATIRRALPGQLFSSTQIPVCLWFFAQNKNADAKRSFRDRRQETHAGLAGSAHHHGE